MDTILLHTKEDVVRGAMGLKQANVNRNQREIKKGVSNKMDYKPAAQVLYGMSHFRQASFSEYISHETKY